MAEPVHDPFDFLPTESCELVPASTLPPPNAAHRGITYSTSAPSELGLHPAAVSMHDYFLGDSHHLAKVFSGHGINRQAQRIEQRTFVDLKIVKLSSGRGGNGCVSFLRDANRPVGPPDGGDGGNGGNVYVQAVPNMSSLHKTRLSYVASDGQSGTGEQLDGKSGTDVVLEVPVGTSMRWIPPPVTVRERMAEWAQEGARGAERLRQLAFRCHMTADRRLLHLARNSYKPGGGWMFKERDEEFHRERDYFTELNQQVRSYDHELMAGELHGDVFPLQGLDFTEPSLQPVLVLAGGRGGMGNMHFLTRLVRNPRFSKVGRSGLTEHFLLELKLLADLGLVGLPNAGKLTFLRAISRARPRVGHWEFTTLQPTVGTIFPDILRAPYTVADIPGIIRGAAEDKGMGLDFLRHIERSGGLVFVVSLELEHPAQDLNTLITEVGPRRMEGKKVLVVATKADTAADSSKYRELQHTGYPVVPICAPRGENIEVALQMMAAMVDK